MVVGLNSHFTLYHHEKLLVKQSPLSLRKSTMSQLIASKSPCHIPSYDLLCILYILSYCIPIVYCIHSYIYIYICTHDYIFYIYHTLFYFFPVVCGQNTIVKNVQEAGHGRTSGELMGAGHLCRLMKHRTGNELHYP